MHDSGTGTQAGGRASALRLGLLGIAELWSQLWLGIDNKVLTQLMDGLRFADGQGQLWPLRVLALDARLRRPLRHAGCSVVVDEAPYPPERTPTGAELAVFRHGVGPGLVGAGFSGPRRAAAGSFSGNCITT